MRAQVHLGDLAVDVVRKDIKNVHLSVHPPTGRVTIAAPTRMSLETIRVFAISKLAWIRQQQRKLQAQERSPPREFLRRESHYVWGRRYLLSLVEIEAPAAVALSHSRLILQVRPESDRAKRQALLDEWYRAQVKNAVPPLLAKWEPMLGVKLARYYVQRMKTKWGSCNPTARAIRLNSELAKKPAQCLEYIVVHELVHLIERSHGDRFVALMNLHMPQWRLRRQELNSEPVAFENWSY